MLQSDNEFSMSEMQKNRGVTDFVFEIKRVENYPNFDKPALKNDFLKTHFLN